jgi:hypothetical protein
LTTTTTPMINPWLLAGSLVVLTLATGLVLTAPPQYRLQVAALTALTVLRLAVNIFELVCLVESAEEQLASRRLQQQQQQQPPRRQSPRLRARSAEAEKKAVAEQQQEEKRRLANPCTLKWRRRSMSDDLYYAHHHLRAGEKHLCSNTGTWVKGSHLCSSGLCGNGCWERRRRDDA